MPPAVMAMPPIMPPVMTAPAVMPPVAIRPVPSITAPMMATMPTIMDGAIIGMAIVYWTVAVVHGAETVPAMPIPAEMPAVSPTCPCSWHGNLSDFWADRVLRSSLDY